MIYVIIYANISYPHNQFTTTSCILFSFFCHTPEARVLDVAWCPRWRGLQGVDWIPMINWVIHYLTHQSGPFFCCRVFCVLIGESSSIHKGTKWWHRVFWVWRTLGQWVSLKLEYTPNLYVWTVWISMASTNSCVFDFSKLDFGICISSTSFSDKATSWIDH